MKGKFSCSICEKKILCKCPYEKGKDRFKSCAINHYENKYPQSRLSSKLGKVHTCSKLCDDLQSSYMNIQMFGYTGVTNIDDYENCIYCGIHYESHNCNRPNKEDIEEKLRKLEENLGFSTEYILKLREKFNGSTPENFLETHMII